MTEAALLITQTSEHCARYELIRDGKRIWINRVVPSDQGHAGARARMAAWALKHGVKVATVEPQKQAVIPGRYGRR